MRWEVCAENGRHVYLPSSEADVNSRARARPAPPPNLERVNRRTLPNFTQTFVVFQEVLIKDVTTAGFRGAAVISVQRLSLVLTADASFPCKIVYDHLICLQRRFARSHPNPHEGVTGGSPLSAFD